MQRNDMEFWNGVFKGTLVCEEVVRESTKDMPDIDKKTVDLILQRLSEIESNLKSLHTHGIKEVLDREMATV